MSNSIYVYSINEDDLEINTKENLYFNKGRSYSGSYIGYSILFIIIEKEEDLKQEANLRINHQSPFLPYFYGICHHSEYGNGIVIHREDGFSYQIQFDSSNFDVGIYKKDVILGILLIFNYFHNREVEMNESISISSFILMNGRLFINDFLYKIIKNQKKSNDSINSLSFLDQDNDMCFIEKCLSWKLGEIIYCFLKKEKNIKKISESEDIIKGINSLDVSNEIKSFLKKLLKAKQKQRLSLSNLLYYIKSFQSKTNEEMFIERSEEVSNYIQENESQIELCMIEKDKEEMENKEDKYTEIDDSIYIQLNNKGKSSENDNKSELKKEKEEENFIYEIFNEERRDSNQVINLIDIFNNNTTINYCSTISNSISIQNNKINKESSFLSHNQITMSFDILNKLSIEFKNNMNISILDEMEMILYQINENDINNEILYSISDMLWNSLMYLAFRLLDKDEVKLHYIVSFLIFKSSLLPHFSNDVIKQAYSLFHFALAVKNKNSDYSSALEMLFQSSRILNINSSDLMKNTGLHIQIKYYIGCIYDDIGDTEESIKVLEEVLVLQKKFYEKENIILAKTYNLLGVCEDNRKNLKKAIEYYNKAISIYKNEGHIEEESIEIAKSLSNIAGIYYVWEDFSKAASIYEKVLKVYQSYQSMNNVNIGMTCNNLGNVYSILGEFDKAERYYNKALGIYIESYDSEHIQIGLLYKNMGDLMLNMNRTSLSIEYFEKCLKIIYSKLGEDSDLYITTKNKIKKYSVGSN
jgi:tetratricopeptide (TPR) repeat protein